jgi:hypothetical protein
MGRDQISKHGCICIDGPVTNVNIFIKTTLIITDTYVYSFLNSTLVSV